tara:strand:+ start:762 stop:1415 length:654 start_codon:yes stop_codon:yes gene_type:complete
MSTIKTNQLAHTANGAATYTLPQTDGSAGQVLQTNGSGVLSWVSQPTGGLDMVDIWDLNHVAQGNAGVQIELGNTSTYNGGTGVWNRATWSATIGSAMTVSNEVFTFPSTGIYEIQFTLQTWNQSNVQNNYVFARIKATTDNGSNWYTRSADGTNAIANGSTVYTHNRAAYLFDVTNTSTHKVKFTKQSAQIATVNGDASADNNLYTYVIFKRLGDT